MKGGPSTWTSTTKVLIGLAVSLVFAGGIGLVFPEKHSADTPATVQKAPDAVHEKAFLNEQLRRTPGHAPILLRLAQIERNEWDLKSAENHLRQAIQADAKQVDARLELGLVLSEQGDVAGAEEQNRAVLRLNPDQPDALYNLGAISANRGDVVQARRFWERAVRVDPKGDSGIKSSLALERLKSGS